MDDDLPERSNLASLKIKHRHCQIVRHDRIRKTILEMSDVEHSRMVVLSPCLRATASIASHVCVQILLPVALGTVIALFSSKNSKIVSHYFCQRNQSSTVTREKTEAKMVF